MTISREARRNAEARKTGSAPWNEAEVRTFLAGIRGDRLSAAMMLALIANRPATDAGRRTLPLLVPVWRALRVFRARQAQERLAAGAAYVDSGYVLVDGLERPWKTDKLRREAYTLIAAAGVRKARLVAAVSPWVQIPQPPQR